MKQARQNIEASRAFGSGCCPALVAIAALVAGCSAGDSMPSDGSAPEPATGLGDDSTVELDQSSSHDPLGDALERARREFAGNHGEPLPEFTAKCDVATGVHVPDFNCSAGTEVPISNFTGGTYPNGNCDRPNRLNKACDPGSRFQVLANSNNSVIVAHCRKTGLPGNLYSDVAVIQYNKVSGATCYYQALGSMDGNFKSPALGTSLATESDAPNPLASPWLSNTNTKAIDCRRCHDNGAIIRSPYLAQLNSGANALPGAGDFTYNKTNPVAFIGNDYQDWKIFSAQVAGNICNNCHRMGFSNSPISGAGTARDFGIRATAMTEVHKNAHSAASPIWMIPNQITYDAGIAGSALQVQTCANAIYSGGRLPAGCTGSEITIPFNGLSPASLAVVALYPG